MNGVYILLTVMFKSCRKCLTPRSLHLVFLVSALLHPPLRIRLELKGACGSRHSIRSEACCTIAVHEDQSICSYPSFRVDPNDAVIPEFSRSYPDHQEQVEYHCIFEIAAP